MPFAYYKKLSPKQRKTYDQSARIGEVIVPQLNHFGPLIESLQKKLEQGHRQTIQEITQKFSRAYCLCMKVPLVHIKILSQRPHDETSELHGLYERDEHERATIKLWMKTARKGQIVSFKTFFRTLIHELMHHLDFTHFHLADSFHTEGFYKRENHVTKQFFSLLTVEKNKVTPRVSEKQPHQSFKQGSLFVH